MNGTTVTANIWNGGTSYFQRTDANGSVVPLVDALGSVLALVDSSGNVATSYTYEPFGNTSVTGTTNGNEFQYTGRENENNGLYYYRARYYSPLLERFTSEDPMGFTGGLNLYAYVFDSPTNLIDPSGNCPTCLEPPIVTTAVAGTTAGTVAGAGAATTGSGSIVTLVSGGSASGSSAGPVGVVVGVGVAAIGGIIYERHELNKAVDAEDRANAELIRVMHLENLAVMQLAGRYTGLTVPRFQETDQRCKEVREECFEKCWDQVQGNGSDTPLLLRKCMRACMEGEDCHNF